MTSQVAVFNLECVAVASDSVLTIGNGSASKTLSSSEKILDLGPGHRVVVMTSGEARFMGVPYGLLLGEWRASLAEPLGTVPDYAESFVVWLASRSDLFGSELQHDRFEWMLRDYYLSVRDAVQRKLEREGLGDVVWDDFGVQAEVRRVVGGFREALESRSKLDRVSAQSDRAYVRKHQGRITEIYDEVMREAPRSWASDRWLTTWLPLHILQRDASWVFDSHVAFIGYGADEVFPGSLLITVHGLVNRVVRRRVGTYRRVTPSTGPLIQPFAQDEAIHTFLRAYNGDFLDLAHQRIDALFEQLETRGIEVEQALGNADLLPESHVPFREQVHRELSEAFEDLSLERFIEPMLDTLGALPKADMARMAESLVGVQALRSASLSKQPSVGGPIDVVVITRAEGVQWLRRKEMCLA